MTKATDRGFVVGLKYRLLKIIQPDHYIFNCNDILTFISDDGSNCPLFENEHGERADVALDRFGKQDE